jgi:hypothetical protein
VTHLPFTGKPGINVDLEDPSNPLQYFELFCTPNIAEVIARETNLYAKHFLENVPNLKLKFRTHCWKEMNRIEIMKLLAFFLLQGLHQKPHNELFLPEENFAGNVRKNSLVHSSISALRLQRKCNFSQHGNKKLRLSIRHPPCRNKPSWECVFSLDNFVSQLL